MLQTNCCHRNRSLDLSQTAVCT